MQILRATILNFVNGKSTLKDHLKALLFNLCSVDQGLVSLSKDLHKNYYWTTNAYVKFITLNTTMLKHNIYTGLL